MVSRNPSSPPMVSVIVPARNEEASLGACLQSLVSQNGVSMEVIVVDDASSDRTRAIAAEFSEVLIVDAPALPKSHTGKNNALAAGANGQYLLIQREAYDAVGGHAAIASSILEDVALARAVKRSGRKIFFRYGADAVCTRMYRSFAQLREGWTKNLVLLFPRPGQLALLRFTEFLSIAGSGILSLLAYHDRRTRVAAWLFAVFVITLGFLWNRIRKAHFSWSSNLLALFGLPLFSYLLLRSK